MTSETRRLPKLCTRAAVRPGSFNQDARTVELSWGRGAPVMRGGFFEDPYIEELDMGGANLSRLNAGAPLLSAHDHYDLSGVIGVVERAWIADGEGRAMVRFSDRPDVAPIVADVANGILRNVSVGYSVDEYQITQASSGPDVYRAVRWTPMELSIVPIPADPSAQMREAPETYPVVITRAEQAHSQEAITMPDAIVETPAAPAVVQPTSVTVDVQAERAAARASERDRIAKIRRSAQAVRAPDDLVQRLIDTDVPLAQAREALLEHAVARDNASSVDTLRATVTVDNRDQMRAGAVEALMLRAGMLNTEQQRSAVGSEYRGMTLLEIARDCVARSGGNARGDKMTVVGRAFTHTSGDFANILATTANKAMMRGWMEAPESFTTWTRPGSLPDFKATTRVDLNSFPALANVPEGGEYGYATIGDRGETVQLATYGKLFSITRQAIINDDLSAFTRIPMNMARAAKRTVGNLVYAILTGNPTMADGIALFHASSHGANLGSGGGSVLAVAGLSAGRVIMMKQTGANSEALNIQPSYLIVPVALMDTARVTVGSEFDPDTANKIQRRNPVAGMCEVVAEARLDAASATAWYLAADPNMFDTIEVQYLDGNDAPYLEQKDGWNVDGVEMKVRIDAGVKALDYRTLYKSAGA